MRVRSASSRLRFRHARAGVGVAVFLAGAALLVVFEPPAAGDGPADAAPVANPDDLVLDLGGGTLEARRVVHGVFTMGAAPGEPGHDKDEEPAHPVTITKDFWVGKYPVTRGQFAKFVADTRYVTDAEKGQAGGAGWDGKPVDGGKGPNLVQRKDFTWRNPGFTQTDTHPVVLVSYGDATAFVGWATRKSGKRVRLPTEAEWEFAARAGTTTAWSGGVAAENDPASYGWFKPNAGNGTRPVGQKKPNPLGIFDMSGDVMEWCRDVYAPYREGAAVDPEATTVSGNEPERRVLRGGSWFRDPKRGRSAARYKNAPGSRMADNGFRVVITNEEAVAPSVSTPGADFVPAAPLGLGSAAGATTAPGAAGAPVATGGPPSGPLADGEAIHVDGVGGSGEPFSWGLLLISPLAAASAVVAWMLLRRKRSPAAARAAAEAARAGAGPRAGARAGVGAGAGAGLVAGVSTRSGTDGFFVKAPDVVPGARVRYACIVNGTEVSDVVPLDGAKETFVYTGSPPTAIRILEIVAGPRGQAAGQRVSALPGPSPQTQTQPLLQRPPPPVPSRPAAPGVPVPPPSSSPASVDVPVSVEVMLLPDAVQVSTEPMIMPHAPPAPPSSPRPPATVPRPPPSSPRAAPDPPRALVVHELAPEASRDATSASAGSGVDVMASTDVDLSSSRDVAVAATKAPEPPAVPAAPAMTAAQAFKVEPLEEEAPKEEAPKDEAEKDEAAKDGLTAVVDSISLEIAKIEVEEPKVEEPKVEEPKVEEPKVEEGPEAEEPKAEEAPKAEEPKAEAPKPDESKPEDPKAEEAPRPEEPKSEAPKPEESKPEEPKPEEEPKPGDAQKPDADGSGSPSGSSDA